MTSGAAGRLSQVEIPYPPYPRLSALAQHHYVRFDWVERHKAISGKDSPSSIPSPLTGEGEGGGERAVLGHG